MRTRFLTVGVLTFCSVAAAQEVREQKQVQVFTRHVEASHTKAIATAPFQFMSSEFDFREEQVKGLPYSAEAVNESTQTLADGNRISRKNSTQIYRDSEGRTRREETINAIGPWASGEPHKLIFVNDPVAKVNWVIDPQLKQARKMSRTVTIDTDAGEAGDTVKFEPSAAAPANTLSNEDVTVAVSGTLVGGTPAAGLHTQALARDPAWRSQPFQPVPDRTLMYWRQRSENAKSESLGRRMIEGVEAEGTKTTDTTPAGEIGNELPIVMESERWYSSELKVTLMTRHSDPRQGETIYKLTNLRRTEPDAALFQPPSDYQVIEAGSQVIHMKMRNAK